MNSLQINQTLIELVKGDIVHQDTEAVVNAANTGLKGGGGVDGAIHRAAGWEDLQAACRQIGGCPTGEAVITGGFKLKAKYIIHAVGPFYRPDDEKIPLKLASAYRRSLEIAADNGIRTLAFPSISTGAYRYPLAEAAQIALETVKTFAENSTALDLVRFVLFDDRALQAFQTALAAYSRPS